MYSYVKHSIVLMGLVSLLVFLSFSLERSDLNTIKRIELNGANYLNSSDYLKFAQLDKLDEIQDLEISVIRDRLEKHPYIENVDVIIENRGIIKIDVYEKTFDALLFTGNVQLLVTDKAEVLPLIKSTRNIDLPVIISNTNNLKLNVFDSAVRNKMILCALKIVTAAKLYDTELFNNISEINLTDEKNIIVRLTSLDLPIYLNINEEVEKTIYLSKIYRHLKGKRLTQYVDYIDLRFSDLVYLGFEESLINEKGRI